MNGQDKGSFAITDFVQSLQAQLDQAQDTLALRVRSGRPLTWALKDVSLDLKVFTEVDREGNVRMRSAGPNEEGASSLQFNLTTITRPMVEENTLDLTQDEDPRGLEEIERDGALDPDTRRRLERVGIRTVGQLKRMNQEGDLRAVRAVTGTPMERLRAALIASSQPVVTDNTPERGGAGERLLRIRGANLRGALGTEVRLAGEPVEVLESHPNELLVRPLSHQSEGQIEVFVGSDRTVGYFRMPEDGRREAGPVQGERDDRGEEDDA
ncbi:MAG: hypothetical protein AAF682_10285 [Planctomycetota bacterium]